MVRDRNREFGTMRWQNKPRGKFCGEKDHKEGVRGRSHIESSSIGGVRYSRC